jgi:Na+/proline symporter
MSTEATIFTGVAVYLVIMLFIGVYAAKRTHSSVDFMVAGRRMPIWICAATLMATWFGGSTMMGSSGAAYEGGLLLVVRPNSLLANLSNPQSLRDRCPLSRLASP